MSNTQLQHQQLLDHKRRRCKKIMCQMWFQGEGHLPSYLSLIPHENLGRSQGMSDTFGRKSY